MLPLSGIRAAESSNMNEKSVNSNRTNNAKELLAQLDAKMIERSLKSFKEKSDKASKKKKKKDLMLIFNETDNDFLVKKAN